jgi:hypothetical protein
VVHRGCTVSSFFIQDHVVESRSESDHDTGGGGQIGNLDQLAKVEVEKMRSQFISLKTPWFTTAKPGQGLVFRGCSSAHKQLDSC